MTTFNEATFVDLIDINRVSDAHVSPCGDFKAAGDAAAEYVRGCTGEITLSDRCFQRGSKENGDLRWVNLSYACSEKLVRVLVQRRASLGRIGPFAVDYIRTYNCRPDLIRWILFYHDSNGWFAEPERAMVICLVEKREIGDLLPYCLEIYERHNIPLDGEFQVFSWKKGLLDSAAESCLNYGIILEYFHSHGLLTHDRVLETFKTFIDRCYHRVTTVTWTAVMSVVEQYLAPTEVPYLPVLAEICADSWPVVHSYAEKYRLAGGDIRLLSRRRKSFIANVCTYIGTEEAVAYLQLHYEPKEFTEYHQVDYCSRTTPANQIARGGTIAALRLLRPLTNAKSTYYVPCYECLNGESAECNYRTVDTEYILRERYGVGLEHDLEGLPDASPLHIPSLIPDPTEDDTDADDEDALWIRAI